MPAFLPSKFTDNLSVKPLASGIQARSNNTHCKPRSPLRTRIFHVTEFHNYLNCTNCIHAFTVGVWILTELKAHRFLKLKKQAILVFIAKAMDGLELKKASQAFLSTKSADLFLAKLPGLTSTQSRHECFSNNSPIFPAFKGGVTLSNSWCLLMRTTCRALCLILSESSHCLFCFVFNPHPRTHFHCFQREGGRKKHRCKREASIGCLPYVPKPGIKPATQVCDLTRNRPTNFQLWDDAPTN